MNGKQIACILLMTIIAAIVYAGQMVHKKTDSMRAEAKAAEDAAEAADNARNIADIKSKTAAADSEEFLRFLSAWVPAIDAAQTSQDIEEAIQASIRSAQLFVDSQKFEPKASRVGKVVPKIIKASIIAEDEYPKTLNWLGELEKRLPLARITICRITPGKDAKSVRLELSIEVPIINLKADPMEGVVQGA